MKTIRFAILVALVAAFSACGGKREVGPVATSVEQAQKPRAEKPVAPPQLPLLEKEVATGEAAISTPEAMTAPAPAATGETEISTVEGAPEKPAEPASPGPVCFFTLCLGMNYEQVEGVVPGLGKDPKAGCETGRIRPLPLPVRAGEVKRFVYYQPCGGPVEHTTLYFYRDELIAFHVYFRPDGFKNRTVGEILEDAKKSLGPPDSEAWEEPGERGKAIWNKGKAKITFEVMSARPFAARMVNTEKSKKAYPSPGE